MKELTLGSLFDGSGGFPLGGILAGITPVWASEIEPFPIMVTKNRLPFMKHYGDISQMNGGEVEPVDIITFGSPCQDMSVAGKRDGLDGSRSSLFYEAVRIVKEMRKATNGKYPRYIVWENVTGAFSSNKGEDFRCVLESICKIKDESISIPRPRKWLSAGEIVGNCPNIGGGGLSVAWRQFDAQYWGVPQRRKRIYLVADFAGRSAGQILFESEGLSRYSAESFRAWQRAASAFGTGTEESGIGLIDSIAGNAESYEIADKAHALKATHYKNPPALVFENHSQDSRYTGPLDTAQTVLSTFGTGGNNQPFVVEPPVTMKIRCGREGGGKGPLFQTDKSATLSCNNDQTLFQPKVYGICAKNSNSMLSDNPNDFAVEEELEPTMVAKGPGAVAQPTYCANHRSFMIDASEEVAGTLQATDYKDPPIVNDVDGTEYIVRRLTPTECARLQGFPDFWCSELGTENPSEKQIDEWKEIFETHRKIMGKPKGKTEKQIREFIKKPHSDSAEYKMWGNGVALPCVYFVLSGIAWAAER